MLTVLVENQKRLESIWFLLMRKVEARHDHRISHQLAEKESLELIEELLNTHFDTGDFVYVAN